MAETVQMNLNVKRETKERVTVIATATFRGMGDVIDWLVAREYQRLVESGSIAAVNETPATYPVGQEG